MSTYKHIDKICCVIIAFAIVLTVIFIKGESFGMQKQEKVMGYESKLFDTSQVHSIDIVMEDWDGFLETCTNEEYTDCSVVIDGEAYKNVAIRAKGNTSLTQVQSYGNDRYSFKIEFDHYDSTKTYYGLDKLCLNNIIQDNTYMKDYVCYQLMGMFGVDSPLCSFVNISVNGETWGLYLAVEGVEDAFLERNYSGDYGELYKPDSSDMGGGRGNGKDFEMGEWDGEDFINSDATDNTQNSFGNSEDFPPSQNNFSQENNTIPPDAGNAGGELPPGGMQNSDEIQGFFGRENQRFSQDEFGGEDIPENMTPSEGESGTQSFERPDNQNGAKPGGGMGNSFGSDDVSLIYTDDDYDSYSNIFNNAKTDITDDDKDRLIQALKNINENVDIENSVDTEEVIRYFVVHNFVLNFDSYTGSMIHNYYLYESNGQLSMIPWDYNLAFGGFQSASDATSLVNYPIDSPVSGGTVDSRPMLAWIFNNEEYTQMYHEYFREFITEIFDSGVFSEMIDSAEELISQYVEEDPTKFCTYEEFLTGVETLKEFCLLRAESITGQLDGIIGSTSEEQQDKENFVDAGNILISDMGSMNNSMGGGMGNRGGMMNSNTADENQFSDEIESPFGTSQPGGMQPPDSGFSDRSTQTDDTADTDSGEETGDLPENFKDNGENFQQGDFPGFENGEINPENRGETAFQFGSQTQSDTALVHNDDWILIFVTTAVLIAGLVFAFLFKRR